MADVKKMAPAVALVCALALLAVGCGSTKRPPARVLTLSWKDNTGGIASTLIERSLFTTTDPHGVFVQIAAVPPSVSVYVDADAVAAEGYCYRVRAVIGDQRSKYSEEACIR